MANWVRTATSGSADHRGRRRLATALVLLSTWTALFLGYFRNEWEAVRPGRFRNFQRDSEILVVGRLVESRQNGIFSAAGFLGAGDVEQHSVEKEELFFDHQYDVYFSEGTFDTFSRYRSQSGGQGWFFSALDAMSPWPPTTNIRVYYGFTALLLALMLALLGTWMFQELGWLPAILMVLSAAASPWLTAYGRNLFYVAGFHFLPMVALTYYLARRAGAGNDGSWRLAALACLTVLLKCLFNGFDFILPALAMLATPVTYFAIRDHWGLARTVRASAAIAGGVALALLVALAVLAAQNAIHLGGIEEAIQYIGRRFVERTAADTSAFDPGDPFLSVTVVDILWTYLSGNTAVAGTGLRFVDLLAMFGGFTALHLFLQTRRRSPRPAASRGMALVATTWLSLSSPLLWFVIFRELAYFHAHTNFLAWYMPFTLFGFALSGYVLQEILFPSRIYPNAGTAAVKPDLGT